MYTILMTYEYFFLADLLPGFEFESLTSILHFCIEQKRSSMLVPIQDNFESLSKENLGIICLFVILAVTNY